MVNKYGEIRAEDVPILESVIELLKKHGFRAGLHGTSLWNRQYKDVDLIVVASSSEFGTQQFLEAVQDLQHSLLAKITEQRGNETIGLDYDIEIDHIKLHLSYIAFL